MQPTKEIKYLNYIALSFFIVAVALSLIVPHHDDCYYFWRWGSDLLDFGATKFYSHSYGAANEYPPLTILICGLFSWFARIVHANEYFTYIIVRLPQVFFVLASIYAFFKLASNYTSFKNSLILTAIFAFAPAIMITILWGQADCFTLFFVLAALLCFVKNKQFLTISMCALGMLVKLQFVFVLPLFALALLVRAIKEKSVGKLVGYFFANLAIYLLIYLPFSIEQYQAHNYFFIITNLFEQVGHYQMFCANAFNLYRALNLNFVAYPDFYTYINYTILIAIYVFVIVSYIKRPTNENLIVLTGFVFAAIFMLSTNMHERYMLAAISPMLISTCILKSKKMLFVNYTFYIVQFVNALFSWISTQWLLTTIVSITFSTVEIIAFILFVVEIVKYSFAKQSTTNVLNN